MGGPLAWGGGGGWYGPLGLWGYCHAHGSPAPPTLGTNQGWLLIKAAGGVDRARCGHSSIDRSQEQRLQCTYVHGTATLNTLLSLAMFILHWRFTAR